MDWKVVVLLLVFMGGFGLFTVWTSYKIGKAFDDPNDNSM